MALCAKAECARRGLLSHNGAEGHFCTWSCRQSAAPCARGRACLVPGSKSFNGLQGNLCLACCWPPPALCQSPACAKRGIKSWNGQQGEFCCRQCRAATAVTPPTCSRPGCGRVTWNQQPGEYCSQLCRDIILSAGAGISSLGLTAQSGSSSAKLHGSASRGRPRSAPGWRTIAAPAAPPFANSFAPAVASFPSPAPSPGRTPLTGQLGPWQVLPLELDEIKMLQRIMTVKGTVGVGQDMKWKEPAGYTKLRMEEAWRVHSEGLWQRYEDCRTRIRRRCRAVPPPQVRTKLSGASAQNGLEQGVNETYLLHSAGADALPSILANGFDLGKSTRGMLGHGVYFAEECEKVDQYATPGNIEDVLPVGSFDQGKKTSRFFILLCRVVLGNFLSTIDDQTCSRGRPIFLDRGKKKALRHIEGSSESHHACIRELGGQISRYREFAVYQAEQVYPEYLIAYKRC